MSILPNKINLLNPQYDLITSRQPRNLLYSGQGGGKTMCLGAISHLLTKHCPSIPGMIDANTYGQLSNSTLFRMFEVWKSVGWTEYDKKGNPNGYYVMDKQPPDCFKAHGFTFENNHHKIYLRNGAVIIIGSLDNYKAIDGTEVGWCLLDETKDTKEEAVKEVILGRLRFKGLYLNKDWFHGSSEFWFTTEVGKAERREDGSLKDINPLYVFTSPAKAQWLSEFFDLEKYREQITASIYSKDDYFYLSDDETKRTVVIYSAWHNEKNLPGDYIPGKLRDLTPELVNSLLYGDPFSKVGGEYYSSFKKSIHIKRCDYVSGLPLHLTFDFNVNPYMTALVWQVESERENQSQTIESENRIKVRCIAEYAMSYPRNTIEDTCRKFIAEYGHLCGDGLFYYGDASGKNTQPYKEQRNHYDVIDKELRDLLHNSSRRVLKSNPRHRAIMDGTIGRRDFMNACLASKYGFDIEIDERCKHLIADLEFIKEDANGAKEKLKVEINGVKCEKLGHHSDAMDAVMCWLYGEWRK